MQLSKKQKMYPNFFAEILNLGSRFEDFQKKKK